MANYEFHKEKSRIYDMLSKDVPEERKARKELIMKQAIGISMDELDELNQKFKVFTDSISHLSIYDHLYKDVIEPYFIKLDTDAQHLIKKNYTSEELDLMPRDTYNLILKQQKIRLELIKAIITKYNLK